MSWTTNTPTGLTQALVDQRNIKLGTLDFHIGAEDLAATSATGWLYAGVIEASSVKTNAPKALFEKDTGFPSTNKITAVTMVALDLSFTLDEVTKTAKELLAGSGASALTYATSPVATTTTAAAPTTTSFTLTTIGAFVKGNYIEVGLSGGAIAAEYVYIEDVTGSVVTVQPPLSVAPTAGDTVKAVKMTSNAIGSKEIPRNAGRLTFTDQWGETMQLWIPAFSAVSPFNPVWSDTKKNMSAPVQLKAYGKAQTWNGTSQSIVGFLYHNFANVT